MTHRKRRTVTAVLVAALMGAALVLPMVPALGTIDKSVKQWWQYDPSTWSHGWPSVPSLVKEHKRWHDNHPHYGARKHKAFHKKLARQYRRLHFHEAIETDVGDATWYDANGQTGACGNTLRGMYVAHRTWPCGSLVSVRANGKYIFVHVEDRGPYGAGRIVDLSKKAFRKLASPSQGVISDVHAVRLKKG
jgi:rare lipoprotein A